MDDKVIEIEINGTTYYISAEDLPYLNYIDGKLINSNPNHTIYLYPRFSTNTTSIYPRIQCSTMSQCRYYDSASVDYTGVTSNYTYSGNFNVNTLGSIGVMQYILLFLILILGVKLLWKR